MLGQSFSPFLYILPKAAYAQEVTPTDSASSPQADSPTPTDTVTPTPTDTITPVPTDTVTPTPTDTITPTDTVVPTDIPTETPVNEPAPQSQDNQNNDNSNQGTTPSVEIVSPEPITLPTEGLTTTSSTTKTGKENVSFAILENVAAPSIDLQAANAQGSASLTTDKLDYAPTDAAVITGTGLLPKTMYVLYVSSTDPPPVNFSTEVTTDDQGTFIYAYQLDGIYRPNYKVELKDSTGNVVASTTFTDSISTGAATTGTGTGTITINKPASTASGDFLIAGIVVNGGSGTTITPPSAEWTLILRTDRSGDVGIATYRKVAGASEPASYTWNISGSNRASGGIIRYTGVDISNPIDVTGGANGNSSSVGAPSITTTAANDLVVAFFGVDNNFSFSPPSGTTERYDVTHSDSSGPGSAADDFTQASAGATGTKTATVSSAEKWVAQQVALREAVVSQPDLTVVKTNNVSGAATNGVPFTWTIHVTNTGAAVASFSNTQTILTDNLPSGPTYGAPSVSGQVGITGTINCGTIVSNDLNCTASGPVAIAGTTGAFDVSFSVTPNSTTTLVNPRSGLLCKVDPSTLVTESNESNNTCSDSATVAVAPTPTPAPNLVWPSVWSTPNSCVSDPAQDENPNEVDLIGTTGTPAVGTASDANYLYFRERINGDPGLVTSLHQFSWVVLFQTSTPQYQYLGAISGKEGNKVLLYDNTTHSPDSGGVDFSPLLNDPADNIVWQGDSGSYGRVTGSGPYYIDWAIPVSELTSRGINTSTTKFFATSTNGNNYNKDHLQCYEQFADLSILKSDSPDPVTSGGVLTYTLAVHNAGPDSASGVIVTDTLPTGYAVTSVTPSQGSCSDTSAPGIQCELGTMANGANANVVIVGTMTGSGTVTNNAAVTLDTTVSIDLNLTNNSDSEDTIINQPTGTINIVKVGENNNSQDFGFDTTGGLIPDETSSPDFSLDDDSNATLSDTKTFTGVAAGTYTVSEIATAGWTLGSIVCTDPTQNSTSALPTAPTATINLAAGETVTCTFTNTLNKGNIKVNKMVDTNGDGDYLDTGEGLNGTASTAFTWTYRGIGPNVMGTTQSGLTSGTGSLSENTVTNYHLVGWYRNSGEGSCANPDSTSLPASIEILTDQTVEITICNAINTGIVIVHKDVQGPNGENVTDLASHPQVSLDGATGQLINENFTVIYDNVPVGSHTITESFIDSNYTLYGISTVAGQVGTPAGLVVNVVSGQTVDVYVTNRQKSGTITVIKDVVDPTGGPISDSHSFTVNLTPGSQSDTFAEGDNAVFTVNPGTYTASESADAAYTNLGCLPATGKDDIVVVSGGQATITCTNRQNSGTVIVHKDVQGPNGEDVSDQSSSFEASLDGGTGELIFDNNSHTFNNVLVGNHTITESLINSNYTLYGISTSAGQIGTPAGLVVNVGGGQTIDVYVTNRQKTGTITVVKDVVKSDGVTDVSDSHLFHVTLNGETKDLAEGTNAVFTVNPGTYTASENDDVNYDELGCQTPTGKDDIVVASNGQVTITCKNKQNPGSISGTKFDDLGTVLGGWTIDLYLCTGLGIGCGALPLASIFTGTDGSYTFSDLLSGFYTVAEGMEIGWTYVTDWFHDLTVGPGDNITGQNFTNKGNLSITACKYENLNGTLRESQTTPVNNWSFTLGETTQNTGEESNCTTFTDLKPGTYTVSENPIPDGWFVADDSEGSQSITLTSENGSLDFYNYRKGGITGLKWNDADKDERRCIFDEQEETQICEDVLSGWTIFIDKNEDEELNEDEQSTVTGTDGSYSFADLAPDTYQVCEVIPTGWEQTYPVNSTESLCHSVTVTSGSVSDGNNFGNHSLTPVIKISKTNNKIGIDQSPGDNVTYTLTINVSQSNANNVTVTDLLPQGFKYRAGSWTASSDTRGDLRTLGVTTEPTYASPGTWQLGDMTPGETVTLTLIADIDGSQHPGLYKDVAWAQGTSLASVNVLALAQPTGFVDTNFVGTDVNVVKDQQSGISIAINKKVGEVLGASTELPATGANNIWVMLASIMLTLGLSLTAAGYIIRKRYV